MINVLLISDYNRPDILRQFIKCNDVFNFSILYFKDDSFEKNDLPPFKKYYWNQFSSSYDVLKKLNPKKIILADIESFYEVALNLACKKKNIPVFLIDHGMRHKMEIDLAYKFYEKKAVSNVVEKIDSKLSYSSISTIIFTLRSLRLHNFFTLHKIIFFFYIRRKNHLTLALHKCQYEFRRPNYYLCISEEVNKFYIHRDGISKDRIINIGNPDQDTFYNNFADEPINGDHYLLIDSPHLEIDRYQVVRKDKTNFIHKINQFCLKKEKKLFIKLHPISYKTDDLVIHSNIVYLRDVKFESFVNNTIAVFGFASSLMVPFIYIRKSCLFKLGDWAFQNNVENIGVCQILDFYTFTKQDISFNIKTRTNKSLSKFEKMYVYKADGNSLSRMKKFIIDTL